MTESISGNKLSKDRARYKASIQENLTLQVKVEKGKKYLYLTFDDGPQPVTAKLLDALDKQGMQATFFVNSNNVKAQDGATLGQILNVLQRILDKHALADHGADHDPEAAKDYKTDKGYDEENIDAEGQGKPLPHPSTTREDFKLSKKTLQAKFKDKFTGFACARLPGDGRNDPYHVTIITDSIKLNHVGWNYEFAPNFTFVKREPLEPEPTLAPNATESEEKAHTQALAAIRERNKKRVEYKAEYKKRTGDEYNPDFERDWQGLKGVACSTVKKGEWPKDRHVVLLHDRHWKGKDDVFLNLVKELKNHYAADPLVDWEFVSLAFLKDMTPLQDYDPRKEAKRPPAPSPSPTSIETLQEEQWFVQIKGGCSAQEAAEVKKKAQSAGYGPVVSQTMEDGTCRVLIGPYKSEQTARDDTAKIKNTFADAFPRKVK